MELQKILHQVLCQDFSHWSPAIRFVVFFLLYLSSFHLALAMTRKDFKNEYSYFKLKLFLELGYWSNWRLIVKDSWFKDEDKSAFSGFAWLFISLFILFLFIWLVADTLIDKTICVK